MVIVTHTKIRLVIGTTTRNQEQKKVSEIFIKVL